MGGRDPNEILRSEGEASLRAAVDAELAVRSDIKMDGCTTVDTGENGQVKAPTHGPYVEQRGRDVLMVETMMVKPGGKPEAPITEAKTDKPKAKGFAFVTYEEARTGSASPRWLLKFLLAYNERSGWVGPPGSLKSAILTALAHAVASGQDFCGKRNKGKCAVIYFALERADLVKRRLRAYADKDGLVDLPIVVVGQTINFMDWNVAEEIIATIDEVEKRFGIKVGLLIVDTLAKAIAAGGGDENTAKDQGKVYANLDRVKERRSVHVAIACHPGKDASKGPRGSSASTGDFGVQIEISGIDIRTATITKNNEGPQGHLASFQPKIHDFGKDEDGDSIDVCLAEEIGGVPPVGKTKLSLTEQATLDCLAEALADKGVPPPITEEIPPSVNRVVSADTWREYVRSRGITTSDLRDTQDKAFRRASKALQKLGRVGCWKDNIWIVE
jgi:hypothetical protein